MLALSYVLLGILGLTIHDITDTIKKISPRASNLVYGKVVQVEHEEEGFNAGERWAEEVAINRKEQDHDTYV